MAERRRWIIEVCPTCWATADEPPTNCEHCEVEGEQLKAVEVMPVSERQALRDSVAEEIERLLMDSAISAQVAVESRHAEPAEYAVGESYAFGDAAQRLASLLETE